MEIEAVLGASGSAAAALAGELSHRPHGAAASSWSQAALAEAKSQAVETVEQQAAHGDVRAINQLKQEYQTHVPESAQALQPPHVHHAPGAHEPGKGDIVDIYD